MAAAGYPDAPRKGDAIAGLDAAARLPGKVFHAGTRLDGDERGGSGGRVLCATCMGATVAEAQRAPMPWPMRCTGLGCLPPRHRLSRDPGNKHVIRNQ